MESLGAYLKGKREERKISLSDLVRETRIPTALAEALEGDRFEALPAPVFVRGFIRAYLRSLGLPPEEALARYQAKIQPPPPPPVPDAPARGMWRQYRPLVACLGSAVVLSGALYAYVELTRPSAATRTVTPPAAHAPAAPPPVAPKEEVQVVTEPGGSSPLRLVVRATEPTWVRVETDEGTTVQELLPISAVREWSAHSRFVLTVGNAGGVELELNGKPLPRLGRSGEVVRNVVLPDKALEPGGATTEARP